MSEEKYGSVDALGNEIIMGQLYGYSTSSDGHDRTVVGRAVKFTPKNLLSLSVEKVQNFLYGQPFEKTWSQDSDKVNIRAYKVFPVKDSTEGSI